jgi:demethylmenaquinone methyltransferase/2-methoxy-6-polyprenyl-1,4-benzoquinol methylase
MFDRIAPRYDLLNHLLSFGQDILWRRKLARSANLSETTEVLDLATGTGDLLIALLKTHRPLKRAVGLDFSENMLAICRQKLAKRGLDGDVELLTADACNTGLPDGSFDLVTMAFGIRNTADIPATLREIHRILKTGGKTIILEFSMPASRSIRRLYKFYLRRAVPLIGGLISGDRQAYAYLDSSIESFHEPEQFCHILEDAAFSTIDAKPLTFGVAHIYTAAKS